MRPGWQAAILRVQCEEGFGPRLGGNRALNELETRMACVVILQKLEHYLPWLDEDSFPTLSDHVLEDPVARHSVLGANLDETERRSRTKVLKPQKELEAHLDVPGNQVEA